MGLRWGAAEAVTPAPARAMKQVELPTSLGQLAVRAVHDRWAAEQLLGSVRDIALKYARARLGRFGAEDVAQDVAQEVCMAVLSALPTYEDRGLPFEAFVYRIAANKAADAQRSLIRGATPVAEIPDAVDEETGPEERVVQRAEAQLAMQLLERLSTQQREIITLRVAVGMSTEETAAAVGMTPGAVRVAQHRALAKLRQLIAVHGSGDVA